MSKRKVASITLGLATGTVISIATFALAHHTFWDASRRLAQVRASWLLVALVAECLSLASFVEMEREILRAGGLMISRPSATAVTLASNAVAITLPLVGSATAGAFSYRQWVRRGGKPPVCTWALLMGGILSGTALAFLGGVAGMATGGWTGGCLGFASAMVGVAPLVGVVVIVRSVRSRARLANILARALGPLWSRVHPRRDPLTDEVVLRFLDSLAAVHLPRGRVLCLVALALINWLADVAVLAASIAAVGVPVPWSHLGLIYLAAIGAGMLSVTPAGIGIVEIAIAAAAIGSGVPRPVALLAALLYRAVSCWAVITAGWIAVGSLHRRRRGVDETGASAVPNWSVSGSGRPTVANAGGMT